MLFSDGIDEWRKSQRFRQRQKLDANGDVQKHFRERKLCLQLRSRAEAKLMQADAKQMQRL